MARFLLKQPGVKYLLSERFCQDSLEEFFSQEPKAGGMTIQLLLNLRRPQYPLGFRHQLPQTLFMETAVAEKEKGIKEQLMINHYQSERGQSVNKIKVVVPHYPCLPSCTIII